MINTRTGAPTDLTVQVQAVTIAADDTTGLAYLPDYAGAKVTVMKGISIVKTIHLAAGAQPAYVTIDPATGLVYVDDGHLYPDGKSKIWVIKGTKVITSIPVALDPTGGAVDPRDGDFYVPEPGADTVTVIRGTKVLNRIDVNSNPTTVDPTAVGVDPTRHLAYVLDEGGVSILHGATLAHTVTAPQERLEDPESIAVDPANHLAYIGTDFNSGSVTILDGTSVKSTVTVGELPGSPVYDPTNGLVIFPSADGPQISVFRGLKDIQGITLTAVAPAVAGVDTGNGRAFIGGYFSDSITELQTPAPGAIVVKRPTHRHYTKGAFVRVKFSCKAGQRNPVISCLASTADGHLLPTNTLGPHHFTVRLHSTYGPVIDKKVTYRVVKK